MDHDEHEQMPGTTTVAIVLAEHQEGQRDGEAARACCRRIDGVSWQTYGSSRAYGTIGIAGTGVPGRARSVRVLYPNMVL